LAGGLLLCIGDFYARWSVKFTAKYFEDRERAQAEKILAG
jgi:hypothetical protein